MAEKAYLEAHLNWIYEMRINIISICIYIYIYTLLQENPSSFGQDSPKFATHSFRLDEVILNWWSLLAIVASFLDIFRCLPTRYFHKGTPVTALQRVSEETVQVAEVAFPWWEVCFMNFVFPDPVISTGQDNIKYVR